MEKSNLLAVSVVVINAEGQVLLRKREKEPDQNTWELFAGYPYLDELPLENAARRILKEKADIDDVTELAFSGKVYDIPNRHPGKFCVPAVFIAKVSSATTSDTQKWFTSEEIKELPMAFDNKQQLIDLGFPI